MAVAAAPVHPSPMCPPAQLCRCSFVWQISTSLNGPKPRQLHTWFVPGTIVCPCHPPLRIHHFPTCPLVHIRGLASVTLVCALSGPRPHTLGSPHRFGRPTAFVRSTPEFIRSTPEFVHLTPEFIHSTHKFICLCYKQKKRLSFNQIYTENNIKKIKRKTQSSTDRIDICTRYHRKRSYKPNTKILDP